VFQLPSYRIRAAQAAERRKRELSTTVGSEARTLARWAMRRVFLEIRFRTELGKTRVISGWALRGELGAKTFAVASTVAIPHGTELSITLTGMGGAGGDAASTASERFFHASSVGYLELTNPHRVIPSSERPRYPFRILLRVDPASGARAEAAIAACEPRPA